MSAGSILIVLPNWVGDGALAAPAIRALQAARPGARSILLGTRRSAPLYGRWPSDALLVLPRRGARATGEIARRLRRLGIDEALVLGPSLRSALLVWLAGVRRRVGHRTNGRGMLLSDAAPQPGREVHIASAYLRLAARLGADPGAPLDPVLPVGGDEVEAAEKRVRALGLEGSRTIALCPGATYGETKRWPGRHWVALGRSLAAEGWSLLVMGGEDERAEGERISDAIGPASRSLAGALDLRGSLALLRALAAAVSNDSGAMHLAAAAGCPVLGLFGSTNPAWTGPLGARSRVLRLGLPCSPCYGRTCPTELECLRDLAPGRVLEEVRGLVAGREEARV